MNIYTNIFAAILLTTAVAGYDVAHSQPAEVRAQEVLPTPSPAWGPTHITSVVTWVETPTPKPVTIEDKIEATFGEDHIMEKVAFCESSYREDAKSKHSTAKGIFQVINGTWRSYGCTGDPLNADDNIKCAKKIYERSGLRPWNASVGCWGG